MRQPRRALQRHQFTDDGDLEARRRPGGRRRTSGCSTASTCTTPSSGKGLGDTSALWDTTSTSVVPHVQGWINSTYPGTGICVSEYNVPKDGGDGNTPDATTGTQEADILGMYGRLGYQVASYWITLVHGSTHLPIYNAMAMYRNYDGNGGRFGAYSIGAASPNTGVNVYAASDSPTNPTKVWVMLVNVSGAAQTGLSITLKNFTPTGSAQVYRMGAAALRHPTRPSRSRTEPSPGSRWRPTPWPSSSCPSSGTGDIPKGPTR